MMQDAFTMYLPSDSNMASHPQNKHSDYTVRLPAPVTLSNHPGADAGWEVALTGVQYTPQWYNFREDVCIRFLVELPEVAASRANEPESGLFRRGDSPGFSASSDYDLEDHSLYFIRDQTDSDRMRIVGVNNTWVYYKMNIKRNYFESVQKLGNAICQEFDRAFKPKYDMQLSFSADINTGMVQMLPTRGKVHVVVNNLYFASVLGMSTKTLYDAPANGAAENVRLYLLNTNVPAIRKPRLDFVDDLYIYTDLTNYQYIGDKEAPILRIVPVTSEAFGRRQYWGAMPLEYLTVNKNYVSTIRIKVCNVRGEEVLFPKDAPSIICTLRFRRKRLFSGI